MTTNTQIPHNKNCEQFSIEQQVAFDLENYLKKFKNRSFAIRNLSKKTSLNEKTIRRLLSKENKPTYQTLYKLYLEFLGLSDFSEVISKCPKIVKDRISDYNPCISEEKNIEISGLLHDFKSIPLFAELFILAGTTPINKNVIAFRYGEYGLEIIDTLIQKKLLQEIEKDCFILAKNIPPLDADCLKFLGEYSVQRFSKTKNAQVHGENVINFYAESLNEAGKKAWLDIDTKSFYKKLEIAKQPQYQGPIPVFTFTATDTIEREKNNVH